MNLTPEQIKAAEELMRPILLEAAKHVQTDCYKSISLRFWQIYDAPPDIEWVIGCYNEHVEGTDLLKLIENLPDNKAAKRKQVESLRSQLATAEQELAKL